MKLVKKASQDFFDKLTTLTGRKTRQGGFACGGQCKRDGLRAIPLSPCVVPHTIVAPLAPSDE